jgi:hypothetical protein
VALVSALVIAAGLALVCVHVWASGTTYYVDNCVVVGSDSNNGTSPSTPWLTLNKVNISSFNPGDSILFRAGCVFRGYALKPPSNGSAGSPVNFAAYGTGANPQINASTVVTGWTNYSGNVWQASITTQPYEVIRNQARTVAETSIAALTANYEFYWASNVLYVYSSTNPGSDGSTWEAAGPVAVGIQMTSSRSYINISNIDLWYSNGVGNAQIYLYPPSGGSISNWSFSNLNLEMAYGNAVMCYNYVGTCSNISFNNVTVTLASVRTGSPAVLTGQGGAYINYPTTNFSWTGGSITYSGNDANLGAMQASDAITLDNCQNCTITGLTTAYNGSSGVNVQNGSNGVLITGGYFHNDGLSGAGDDDEVEIGSAAYGSSNVTLSNSELFAPTGDNFIISATSSGQNMTNVTVEYCLIHGSSGGAGIHIDSGSTGIVLAYNMVYNNARYGFYDITSGYGTPGILMYGSDFWGNGNSGSPANWYISATGGTSAYNNIIGNANGSATGNGSEIVVASGDSLTAEDYNDWFHSAGGNFMSYHGTATTLSGWQSATGLDARSLGSDPSLAKEPPGVFTDFKLRNGSRALGAGMAGLPISIAFGPSSASFASPVYVDQNRALLGWNIGAFAGAGYAPGATAMTANVQARPTGVVVDTPAITLGSGPATTTATPSSGAREAQVQWNFGTVSGSYSNCTVQANTSYDGVNYLALGAPAGVMVSSNTLNAWNVAEQLGTTGVSTASVSAGAALGFGLLTEFTFSCSSYGTSAPVTVSVIYR